MPTTTAIPIASKPNAAAKWNALSVIVPCYNELESLDKLAAGLTRLKAALGTDYQLEVLLIDDGSTDGTPDRMRELFATEEGIHILEHRHNRGIAAAMETGIRAARAEVVAMLDADCTYDPLQLVAMLDLLTDGVDMVVASPYHPLGQVEGVPGWRLGLSRMASRMYGLVLHNKLATYTSCVRVCRKASIAELHVRNEGFVGIVELLWQLDCRGGRVVECPAVLQVRTTGQSKMRVARATLAHLRLLARAACRRVFHRQQPTTCRSSDTTTETTCQL